MFYQLFLVAGHMKCVVYLVLVNNHIEIIALSDGAKGLILLMIWSCS